MIPIAEALEIIERETGCAGSEPTDLGESIGRILAEDVSADMDMPPFDRSQMDGFAFRAGELTTTPLKLEIAGESVAGKGWDGQLKPGQAVRIMTGAPIPAGANAVQKIELTREKDGFIEILESASAGQFIVARAGEIHQGTKIFPAGRRINELMIAVLASFGCATLKVSRPPRVSVLSTGSEIVPAGQVPGKHEIRDSNSWTLKALAEQCGALVQILPTASDNIENLKSQIAQVAGKNVGDPGPPADMLVLTGGVSMGDYDFTKPALRELGAEIFFEKVSLKPGKPCVFGRLGETLIFGLPGNPVSVTVTFYLFVRTALMQMQGAADTRLRQGFGILSNAVKGAKERDSFLPAAISYGEAGRLSIQPIKFGGSSDFVSFSAADCLVAVPKGQTFTAGEIVKIVFLP
jgi:molybdopterin molybdotransferase